MIRLFTMEIIFNNKTFILYRPSVYSDIKYYSVDDSVLDMLKEIDIRDNQINDLMCFKKSVTSRWYFKLFSLWD